MIDKIADHIAQPGIFSNLERWAWGISHGLRPQAPTILSQRIRLPLNRRRTKHTPFWHRRRAPTPQLQNVDRKLGHKPSPMNFGRIGQPCDGMLPQEDTAYLDPMFAV